MLAVWAMVWAATAAGLLTCVALFCPVVCCWAAGQEQRWAERPGVGMRAGLQYLWCGFMEIKRFPRAGKLLIFVRWKSRESFSILDKTILFWQCEDNRLSENCLETRKWGFVKTIFFYVKLSLLIKHLIPVCSSYSRNFRCLIQINFIRFPVFCTSPHIALSPSSACSSSIRLGHKSTEHSNLFTGTLKIWYLFCWFWDKIFWRHHQQQCYTEIVLIFILLSDNKTKFQNQIKFFMKCKCWGLVCLRVFVFFPPIFLNKKVSSDAIMNDFVIAKMKGKYFLINKKTPHF